VTSPITLRFPPTLAGPISRLYDPLLTPKCVHPYRDRPFPPALERTNFSKSPVTTGGSKNYDGEAAHANLSAWSRMLSATHFAAAPTTKAALMGSPAVARVFNDAPFDESARNGTALPSQCLFLNH